MGFRPTLGQPIRFLAAEWREDWEFDHPTVLLEPVFRYSPNGESPEGMIEDAAIDIAVAADHGDAVRAEMHHSDRKEFDWRGWDLAALREAAEAVLRGEPARFGVGYVGVLEQTVVFREQKGDVVWDVTNENAKP